MTTRSELQKKTLDDLREIAGSVGIETDGLQKAKLIAAILDSAGIEVKEDAPEEIEIKAQPREAGDNGQAKESSDSSESDDQEGNRSRSRRRRNRGRREQEPIDESELEEREG